METEPPTRKRCHKHERLNDYFATYGKSNTLLPPENGYCSKALRVNYLNLGGNTAPATTYNSYKQL